MHVILHLNSLQKLNSNGCCRLHDGKGYLPLYDTNKLDTVALIGQESPPSALTLAACLYQAARNTIPYPNLPYTLGAGTPACHQSNNTTTSAPFQLYSARFNMHGRDSCL